MSLYIASTLLFSLLLVKANAISAEDCSSNSVSVPRGPRLCAVRGTDDLRWGDSNSGCLSRTIARECQVFAGMDLTIKCELKIANDERIEIYKNNSSVSSSDTLNVVKVGLDDGGDYECRVRSSSSWKKTSKFTVVVSSDLVFGFTPEFCSSELDYRFNASYNCCSINANWPVDRYTNFFGKLYAFNNIEDISVQQEWITPASEHFHTDLSLTVRNYDKSTGNFQVVVEKFPVFLSRRDLIVAAIVTIRNANLHSLSFYNLLSLERSTGDPYVSANTSLPKDITASKGQAVAFTCSFNSSNYFSETKHVIEYYVMNENGTISLEKQYTVTCDQTANYTDDTDDAYSFNATIATSGSTRAFVYNFYIFEVDIDNNNSILSCSLEAQGQIQWQKNATLLLVTFDVSSIEERITAGHFRVIWASGGAIAVTFVLVIVSSLVFLTWLWRRHKKTNFSVIYNIPLINSDSDENAQETVASIVSVSGCYNSKKQQPLVRETYVEDECCDNSYVKEESDTTLNSSIYSGVRGLAATLNYCDPDDDPLLEQQPECCVVYISYTENKADWVYDYLKPLIESWGSQVILHEEDMIPGFTVSGERQRLIREAHRMVLVVSEKYISSPWCLYELQHAISKEPVLFKGRIIPIMMDGYHTLPAVLKGIVPLFDSDPKFEVKLKKNISKS